MTTTKTKITTAEQFFKELQIQVPRFINDVVSHLQERYRIDCSNLIADHVCWRTETMEEYLSLVECLQTQHNDDDIGNDGPKQQQQLRKQSPQNKTKSLFELLIESEIGGRPIATFGISKEIGGIPCGNNPNHFIDVIEIPSPKTGSPYRSGLEHVEFVIGAVTKKEKPNHPSSPIPPSTPSSTGNHKYEPTIVASPMNDSIHQDSLKDFMQNHLSKSNSKDTSIVPTWNTKALSKPINPDISLKLKLDERLFGTCTVKFHLMPLGDVIAWEKKHNHGDDD